MKTRLLDSTYAVWARWIGNPAHARAPWFCNPNECGCAMNCRAPCPRTFPIFGDQMEALVLRTSVPPVGACERPEEGGPQ